MSESVNPAMIERLNKQRYELKLEIDSSSLHVKRESSWVDVIVSPNKLSVDQSFKALIHNIFERNESLLSIYSTHSYHLDSLAVIDLRLSYHELSRSEVLEKVLHSLKSDLKINSNRILCIPRHPDDALSAIMIKELFDIPLCTYIAYDQNVYADFIPRKLMQELLTKSSLRLAICPKLRDVYESQYGVKFWLQN
jgi:hypothetical protein